MTANVAGQEWMGWKERASAARSVLARARAHIIGYQEQSPESLAVFREAKPGHDFYPGEPFADILIQTVSMDWSRFRRLDCGTFWLSTSGKPEKSAPDSCAPRGTSWQLLWDLQAKRRVMHINSHLDNVSARGRRAETLINLRFIGTVDPEIPIVYTADSNVSIASPNERWREPDMQEPYTFMQGAGFRDAWVEAHPGEPRPCT
ncbi:MAG TPA: hypothetical protein VEA36_01925, partial [Candidatus Paceibacterota bacterium]|nr:hypothetical protein [Candidatus Paceibacterota bacterium]